MDDMETVRQRFEADVQEYLAEIDRAAEDARKLAAANEEAKAATAALRDKAAEAADAFAWMRREEDKAADGAVRLEGLSLELGHVRDKAAEAAVAVKKLKDEERAAADAGLLAKFFGGGGGGLGSGLMSGPALLALIPAIEALLPLAAGLLSGFAAAGAGAGAFALLAVPAVKSVTSAYQGLSAAQQKYQAAVALENLDPSKAHARAVQAALDQVNLQRQALEKLPPAERQAVSGIQQLTGEFGKMSRAFAPEAYKVFAGVLKLANDVLPTATPFAKTFADSVSGLLGKLSGFVAPPGVKETLAQFAGPHGESVNAFQQGVFRQANGFKEWLGQFRAIEGPAIQAIGHGVGQLAINIGKLLTAMSAKDVVNAINIAFTILNGTIQAVTYMVKRLMDNWDGMSVFAKHSAYDIRQWSHDVSKSFDEARHWVATMAHDAAAWFDFMRHHAADLAHNIAAHFDEIRHDIARWADDTGHDVMVVVHWFERLPGWILHAVESFPHLLYQAGRWLVEGLIHGIEDMAGSAVSTVRNLGSDLLHGAMSVLGISSPSKEMAKIGQYITQGLILGMQSGIPQLTTMSADLANAVKAAVTGKLISAGEGDTLLTWLAAGNARLKTLARERQNIVDTINAERKYAASTASSIAGNFAISGFATSGLNGGAATVGQVISGLRLDVGAIRRWAHNIHKLAKEGLNRNYLAQLIQLGPVAGAALVAELANAGLGDIKAINSAEYEINQASGQVGKLAASAMYDTGRNAGKGFLVGLLEQKKAITQLMEEIARSMIAALKKELKVSVPGGAGGYAIGGAGGNGGSPSVHVSVPVNVQGGGGAAYQSPEFMQYMQRIVQEAVLRYGQLNASNGFTPAWGRG